MKFIKLWLIEFFHTAPLILGFLFAVKLFQQHLLWSVLLMTGSIFLSLLITWAADSRNAVRTYSPRSMLVFFVFYVFMAVIFIVYFSDLFAWLNWKMDILLGIITALLLAAGRRTITPQLNFNPIVYGLSLCLFFPLIILSLRFSLQSGKFVLMIICGLVIALFSSLLITFVEYKKLQAVETIPIVDVQ